MALGNNLWYLGAQFMAAVQARDLPHAEELLKKIITLIQEESDPHFSHVKLRVLQVLTNANRAAFAAGASTDRLASHSQRLIEQIDRVDTPEALHRIALDTLARSVALIPAANDYRDRLVQEAITYIRQHFSQSLSRDQVAAHLECSPAHFSRTFSRNTGYSFSDFLLQCRLEKAKELLRQTRLHISEIAAAVGYEDPFQFSRTFRKRTGVSPRQYRESRTTPAGESRPMQ